MPPPSKRPQCTNQALAAQPSLHSSQRSKTNCHATRRCAGAAARLLQGRHHQPVLLPGRHLAGGRRHRWPCDSVAAGACARDGARPAPGRRRGAGPGRQRHRPRRGGCAAVAAARQRGRRLGAGQRQLQQQCAGAVAQRAQQPTRVQSAAAGQVRVRLGAPGAPWQGGAWHSPASACACSCCRVLPHPLLPPTCAPPTSHANISPHPLSMPHPLLHAPPVTPPPPPPPIYRAHTSLTNPKSRQVALPPRSH